MPDSIKKQLVLLGKPCVGKSTMTIMFINKKVTQEYYPTMHVSYNKSLEVNNRFYDLTVYDTAGLEEQSQISSMYLEADGFILVYSITDRESFNLVQTIYYKVRDELNGGNQPIILIGNKSDLTSQRQVQFDEGKRLADEWGARFLETSATCGNNVDNVFTSLLTEIEAPNSPFSTSDNQNNNKSSSVNSNTIKSPATTTPTPDSANRKGSLLKGFLSLFKK